MNLFVVTGHTRGLGEALVERLAREAENEIIALGRAPDGPIAGGIQMQVDVGDVRAVEGAFERIGKRLSGRRYGKAVLVNNAGMIGPVGRLDRVATDELVRNLVVNLVAPILAMRCFLQATADCAPLRRVINISSGAGRRPISGWGAYCAAKAGLDMVSRVAALEAQAAHAGVQVVSLAPGVIDTGMQDLVRSATAEQFADVERFREMKAAGELRDPADVAADILVHEKSGKLFAEPVADLRTLAA